MNNTSALYTTSHSVPALKRLVGALKPDEGIEHVRLSLSVARDFKFVLNVITEPQILHMRFRGNDLDDLAAAGLRRLTEKRGTSHE